MDRVVCLQQPLWKRPPEADKDLYQPCSTQWGCLLWRPEFPENNLYHIVSRYSYLFIFQMVLSHLFLSLHPPSEMIKASYNIMHQLKSITLKGQQLIKQLKKRCALASNKIWCMRNLSPFCALGSHLVLQVSSISLFSLSSFQWMNSVAFDNMQNGVPKAVREYLLLQKACPVISVLWNP